MKVIVTHPTKQHTPGLLRALQGKEILQRFFTLFAANKLPFDWARLRRRYFPDTPNQKIRHRPLLFLASMLLKWDLYEKTYLIFDRWVSRQLAKDEFDLVIGYENANLETYRRTKVMGKITVLDLAAVHHIQNERLWKEYPAYRSILPNEAYFRSMNERKVEALQYTDYCWCLSTYAQETMIDGGFAADRIYVVNLGIDPAVFSLRPAYNSNRKRFRILFVGRMSALKGLPELFRVIDDLKKVDIELRLVGPENPGEQILQDLPNRTSHHTFVPKEQLVAEYQSADVFINFSYTDSWAQTVIESMACGTPVIVTENTGAKDAVEQGGGFVIPVADTETLKEKILHFYENRAEVERMGREAHRVAQQYTWENYHQQVIAALEDIAQREGIS